MHQWCTRLMLSRAAGGSGSDVWGFRASFIPMNVHDKIELFNGVRQMTAPFVYPLL